ncbi:hypothetical protein IU443_26675 [Nocardia farcinica]|uniref:Uncharacterized protein n=1 Tax=Nocardia farcinica TaxID=37329 RepID=A0A0H5NQ92_NOCFR|nr:hypothetical protein [Nocardia farcinica]AXK85604.1 hypothetical protein DXT66_08125 [Nocardia farcinica]MBF6258794.1 hypothetical protein [Nocardia farcinica]MBF6265600.1 hypothetical protein [Nocardia farcinica]MBF6281729.1 hypothetical protein [Nocardia farcinica]MBF6308426.1 hypothetical protein [Nocardia farcinica]
MLRGVGVVVSAALLVGFFAVLGVLVPPRESGVGTDRLGPEHGEAVADYRARARQSLDGADTAERWALVSFTAPLPPGQLTGLGAGLRIAQVLYQVPMPRVRTPLTVVPVPAGAAAVLASAEAAASQLRDALDPKALDPDALDDTIDPDALDPDTIDPDTIDRNTADERYRRVLGVAAQRLTDGCACAVGVVVRGPLDRLRTLAENPAVRAVEALPADAIAGRFGVVPLLPEHVDVVAPGPDDGPVPDR